MRKKINVFVQRRDKTAENVVSPDGTERAIVRSLKSLDFRDVIVEAALRSYLSNVDGGFVAGIGRRRLVKRSLSPSPRQVGR